MRSGTSCVTGLLEQCGFNLGQNIRVLRDETPFNPKGHFEHDLLYAINERLLIEVPGDTWTIWHVPEAKAMQDLAAQREHYFRLFLRKFDGNLCKDPLFCLTLPFWQSHWTALRRIVFCLRHPLAVAQSMQRRYALSLAQGLELWQTYTQRFFASAKQCPVYIFDFDAFTANPLPVFSSLLAWLEQPRARADLEVILHDFYGAEHVHWTCREHTLETLPRPIQELYTQVRAHSVLPCSGALRPG